MRYYIVTGEPSGEMHGADLIVQIKKEDPDATFWSCGGKAMEQALGHPCAVNCTEMAYMGLDFIKHFYHLWRLFRLCKKNLLNYKPDWVILIDYSGFNMRLAAFARKYGLRVCYYIPPKIWAHGGKRITKLRRDVDIILSILPFEAAYYHKRNYFSLYYVGNPLVHRVDNHTINPLFLEENGLEGLPIIALLPGSRIDEVLRILPIMLTQVAYFPSYQFVVAGLSSIPFALYKKLVPPTVKIVYNQTYDLMAYAKMGVIASGTASLEAALFNLAQIVVYKLNPLAYFFYKSKATITYISLVNLLMEQGVVPELIQYQFTPTQLYAALTTLLDGQAYQKQLKDYSTMREKLGGLNASQEAAKIIVNHAA